MSVTRNADVCTDAPGACRDSVDVAPLLYVAGVDAGLCDRFALLSTLFSLTDCTSTLIPITTPIVTCASFPTLLCTSLAALTLDGPVELGVTELVGKDCSTYTVPETPIIASNSTSIGITSLGLFGHSIQANLIISPTAGNALTLQPNGVYVPTVAICTQIAALPIGAPSVPNVTSFVGDDCEIHVQTETLLVVTDTDTINFTVSGTSDHSLTGTVIVDPDSDNLLVAGANGLALTCAAVQACVPAPFTFVSPSALSHVINHSLGNAFPTITVWDTVAGAVVIPDSIISNTINVLTINFFVATAIAGTIVG